MRVCARLDTFRGDAKFGTWLYRLAYNLALEHRRHARISTPHLSAEVLERMAANSTADDLQDGRRKFVAALLEELPDLYRTVINLRYWLDHSVEEIAQMLDIPVGTVKSYLFRAREQLKLLAKEQGLDFLD
jgi:RNA polymerase sigma factor (sigma-70 family)